MPYLAATLQPASLGIDVSIPTSAIMQACGLGRHQSGPPFKCIPCHLARILPMPSSVSWHLSTDGMRYCFSRQVWRLHSTEHSNIELSLSLPSWVKKKITSLHQVSKSRLVSESCQLVTWRCRLISKEEPRTDWSLTDRPPAIAVGSGANHKHVYRKMPSSASSSFHHSAKVEAIFKVNCLSFCWFALSECKDPLRHLELAWWVPAYKGQWAEYFSSNSHQGKI